MYEAQKAELPSSELGSNRCFQIEYYGHGDILVSAWNGSLDLEPSANDGMSIRFGLAHGNDVIILASFAGYLKRLGKSDGEVRETMREAGSKILDDDPENLRLYHNPRQNSIDRIADGEPLTRFDELARSLSCLVLPVPSQPGLIEETGGTGIYTRGTEGAKLFLVFAGFTPTTDSEGKKVAEIDRTEEFCELDVPTMARLVCNLALGEYRTDIQSFLANLYTPKEF